VWAILTDAAAYPQWDPNMERIEGKIGPGEKLVLYTKLSKRPFKVTVSQLEPNKVMVWSGGMPMGLFKGERTLKLNARNGKVHTSLREEFTGLLSPLIGRSIPDLNPSFREFVQGLKARAEAAGKKTA
jgi:hypothetical protein